MAGPVKYLDVSPTVDQGPDDEFGPAKDEAVYEWLVNDPQPDWTVTERIAQAAIMGRYDIVDELTHR